MLAARRQSVTQLPLPLRFPRKGNKVAYGAPMLPPFKFERTPDGCWLWLGATITNRNGDKYGVMKHDGRQVCVHRYMSEKYHGPIPEGYDVHHVCFTTLCGNPAHLQAVPGDSNLRARRKRRR